MQFVKAGPAKLFQTAQEQLKKAEEVKKIREKKKDDSEDWQSVSSDLPESCPNQNPNHILDYLYDFILTEFRRLEIESAKETRGCYRTSDGSETNGTGRGQQSLGRCSETLNGPQVNNICFELVMIDIY